MQPFECRKSPYSKYNNIASSKKRKNPIETSILLRSQSELVPTTPEPVARASLLVSAPEAPFTLKNIIFRANPKIQTMSMIYKNEALARCCHQIPKIGDVKMTLSCDAA